MTIHTNHGSLSLLGRGSWLDRSSTANTLYWHTLNSTWQEVASKATTPRVAKIKSYLSRQKLAYFMR